MMSERGERCAPHLDGLRDGVRAERHPDAAGRGAADGHVEEDNRVGHFGVVGGWLNKGSAGERGSNERQATIIKVDL